MRIEDAYKWLYHATLGGEHAVTSMDQTRRWMNREWAELGSPFVREPVRVPLTPDGTLLRVNLRPYKAKGGDPEMMTAMFFLSAQSFRGDKREFVEVWRELGGLLRRKSVGKMGYWDWARLDRQVRPDYPAIHHSATFERSARPAYRVVQREVWASAPNGR